MIKSFVATDPASVSARPVVVVIPIPDVNAIPAGKGAFAADSGGITNENLKLVAEPTVGVPAVS